MCIRDSIDTDPALTKVIPIQGMPTAPHLDFAGEVKKMVNIPIFHASKINDISTARYAIESGKLDMVGMTRAHIADPYIIKKLINKEEEKIRPCVGATYCLDRIYEGKDTLCIHNPATGREMSMPHLLKKKVSGLKKIIVVGAGPAGLEAARVCSEQGHSVTVFEASDKPGGQINLITRSKRRKDMAGIIDWRINICEANKVKFNFNSFASKDEILSENPDIVIIATGGIPNTDILNEGSDLVASTWDILSGNVNIEDDVILYDDGGNYPGLQAAEMISSETSKLEIVTPERFFSPDIGGMNFVPYGKNFYEKNVKISLNSRVKSVFRKGNRLGVKISSDYSDLTFEKETSQVIVEHGTSPVDDLYFELKDQSKNLGQVDYKSLIKGLNKEIIKNKKGDFFLFRVGDAISSRNIHAAIYDSLRICKDF